MSILPEDLALERWGLHFTVPAVETDYWRWRVTHALPFTRIGMIASVVAWTVPGWRRHPGDHGRCGDAGGLLRLYDLPHVAATCPAGSDAIRPLDRILDWCGFPRWPAKAGGAHRIHGRALDGHGHGVGGVLRSRAHCA